MMDVREKIAEFIEQGNSLKFNAKNTPYRKNGVYSMVKLLPVDIYEEWKSNLKLYLHNNLSKHYFYAELEKLINKVSDDFNNYQTLCAITAKLKSIASDEKFFDSLGVQTTAQNKEVIAMNHTPNNEVFIVHGHDREALAKTENFIRKIGLVPIILFDQVRKGKTIIENLEEHTDVGFAIVLYTRCDEMKDGKFRARQNVVLEHGYLMGKLQRDRVVALKKGDVEIPSDFDGVVYITMDNGKEWEMELVKELKAAGYDADANKI